MCFRAPRTVPQVVSAQMGLGDDEADRAYSAPGTTKDNMDALPINSPDSSEGDGSDTSSLSNISEAHGADDEDVQSAAGTPKESALPLDLPSETIDPLELMSGSESKSNSARPMAPRGSRPVSNLESGEEMKAASPPGSRGGSAASGRLGSARHQVLPPIDQRSKPNSPLPAY